VLPGCLWLASCCHRALRFSRRPAPSCCLRLV
jgi:hypothetical protein